MINKVTLFLDSNIKNPHTCHNKVVYILSYKFEVMNLTFFSFKTVSAKAFELSKKTLLYIVYKNGV